jgi:threonine synthase
MTNPLHHQLQCRECGKTWGNVPRSFCEDCFSPLELAFDYEALRKIARKENLAGRDFNMWRYSELLPLQEDYVGPNAVGGTPLVASRKLVSKWGLKALYFKNDAVCFPSLSFKDRVVGTALAAARRFGFETVGCSSTGNLANAVAAQAAQQGFDACVFIPADLEPAKVLNTAVYGARIVRINGNYDQVNRLCAQIADRFQWGLVNVNLRPYYSEGSKTCGYEIAEQLGWTLPDNVVVPMAGGSLITKIAKAFRELVTLGWVPAKPNTIARSLAIGNPADGPFAIKQIRDSGGWAEDISDLEIVEAIKLLAETEGIFAETAGGVTTGVAQKLVEQGRIRKDETTVVCITGNGLKTTDAIAAEFPATEAIAARLEAFEDYLDAQVGVAKAAAQ